MMKIKTLIRSCQRMALLLIALLATASTAIAYDFEEGGVSYYASGTTATVTGADISDSGEVVIPETVTYEGVTYTVTAIADQAFYNCADLISVELPQTITAIGTNRVNNPGQSFAYCTNLKSIVIPDNVETIGKQTFLGCIRLKSVTIGKSIKRLRMNKSSRYFYAFQDCDSITSLTWNAVNCADNGNMGTSCIEQVTIGDEVQVIPANFAKESQITEVTIPNSVTSIGSSAFQGCSQLKTLTWNAINCSGNGNMETANIEQLTIGPDVQVIPANFASRSKITEVTIPNSVLNMGGSAFELCEYLERIDIPNSVTSIGNYAFKECYFLSEVTMGSAVTSIGDNAFDYCSNLTKVNISSIEAWCGIDFKNLHSNPLNYAHHLYLNDQEITDLVIPNSVAAINDYAFIRDIGLTSVNFGESVASIGESAFYGCTGLTNVTLGNSITTVEWDAFRCCSALTSLTLGESVTEIGCVIGYCPNITTLSVESGNPVYDSRDNCNAIIETATNKLIMGCQNTVIPRTVTGIDVAAFIGCENLTSIFIPNSVVSIGVDISVYNNDTIYYYNNPFQACTGLKSIIVENGNPVYDSRDNCNAIIETASNTLRVGCKATTIPNTITTIGSFAFAECTGLASIDIPNSVTSISEQAFYFCTGLTNIDIPNSVTSIGDYAFYYCFRLANLTIGNSLSFIGSSAFGQCWLLTSVVIPNSVVTEDLMGYVAWFWGCSKLEKVTIGSGITQMGITFWECPNITSVTCLATTPPGWIIFQNSQTKEKFYPFDTEVVEQATLYVPAGVLDTYKTAAYWKNFQDIRPLGDADGDGTVGIADVTELIDYLLAGGNGFDMGAADVDGDGTISIADVTDLIDTILNP